MTESRPSFALRDVPYAIYVALALDAFGTLLYTLGTVAATGGEPVSPIQAFNQTLAWFALDQACWTTYAIALPLGLLELARRQTGSARTLTLIGASSGFVPLLFFVARTALPVVYRHENVFELQRVMGIGTGLLTLAGAILLTIAADAWRRVPVAAVGLILLYATTGWMPVIGDIIQGLLGHDRRVFLAYSLVRDLVLAASYVFVCGALAANGRLVPDTRRVASGFSLARLAMMLRVIGALVMIFVLIAAIQSQGASELYVFGGPLMMIATMVLFTIGLLRAASAGVTGVPQLRIASGALLVLWSTAMQLFQLTHLRDLIRETDDVPRHAVAISIVAPILGALGMALIASAIAAFARVRANEQLAGSLTTRTIVLLVIMLGGLGLQHYAVDPGSAVTSLALLGVAMLAGIFALGMMFGILRDGMTLVETPELPPARVV